MRSLELEAMLVTNPKDVGYLTGFHGEDSYLLLGRRGKPIILSDARFAEEVHALEPAVRVVMRTGTMMPCVASEVSWMGPVTLGIQDDAMLVSQRTMLVAALKAHKIGKKSVVGTRGVVAGLRRHKSADEIKHIKQALKIQQQALLACLDAIAPGQTEAHIAARLEFEMKTRGSSQPSFETIVAAGANGSRAHHRPGSAKTRAGKTLLIDWGAISGAYHGDMTRTFAFGRWPKEMKKIYEIVLEAHEAGAASLRPGVTGAQADAAARDVIVRAGYGDRFGHSLGHGLGLDVHEGPGLSRHSVDVPLGVGDVVTIEPGIYLPGVGGVRIEDVYHITERGSQNLCSMPKSLEFATLS